jgi:hypothetical protein
MKADIYRLMPECATKEGSLNSMVKQINKEKEREIANQ